MSAHARLDQRIVTSPDPVVTRTVGPPPFTVPTTCCLSREPCDSRGCSTWMEPLPVSAFRVNLAALPRLTRMLPEPHSSLHSKVGRPVTSMFPEPASARSPPLTPRIWMEPLPVCPAEIEVEIARSGLECRGTVYIDGMDGPGAGFEFGIGADIVYMHLS